jgi:phosphoribosylformylglycinamidine synthase
MKVYVSLRNSILDPQGQAICEALNRTGYDFVKDVRVSKVFDIKIEGDEAAVRAQVEKFSAELLANPIIETFRIEEA